MRLFRNRLEIILFRTCVEIKLRGRENKRLCNGDYKELLRLCTTHYIQKEPRNSVSKPFCEIQSKTTSLPYRLINSCIQSSIEVLCSVIKLMSYFFVTLKLIIKGDVIPLHTSASRVRPSGAIQSVNVVSPVVLKSAALN